MTDPNAVIYVVAQTYMPALLGMVGQVMVDNLWHEQRLPPPLWRTQSAPRGSWRDDLPPRGVETR
jgi:hypothetical protein